MSNFYIGQKVCCIAAIDDGWWIDEFDGKKRRGPKIGEICTIKIISTSIEGATLRFVEYIETKQEYYAEYFRPLVETDISIFQAILADPSKPIEDEEIRTPEGVPFS